MGQGEHRGIALGGPRQGGPGTAATGLRWGARGAKGPEVGRTGCHGP